MRNLIYNWKRFWCPRESEISLTDRGYLCDPDTAGGKLYNPHLVSFESISEIPCLILLGEPGIGKTKTIESELNHIAPLIEKQGDQILFLNLRSYGNEERLIRELFGSSPFVSWEKGKHNLHIFLDSLDECLLRIDNLASILLDELEKYSVERLYLRIACRPAEWPSFLERGLEKIWGKDAFKVYKLAPLRRVDVIEAAQTDNLDSDAFLCEIDQKEVASLAIKPVTLNFLLNTYRRNRQLPSTQLELYFQGCKLLCEESSERRIAARLKGNLTARARLAIASRIAAVTVFANRYSIWTTVDQGDVPEEDVVIPELCGGSEDVNGQEIVVNDEAIRETMNTGLFSSHGLDLVSWSHQTYAEFLAAWYLVRNKMAITKMKSLIIHPGDVERKLVPQLRETASWLAVMVPEMFLEIMNSDPEILLRNDLITVDLKSRVALAETILKIAKEERILDRDLSIYRKHFKKLNYPELPSLLHSYISDTSKGINVRRIAISIAEACKLQVLENEIVKIALTPSEELDLRVKAAYAIASFGSNEAKKKMKTLALGHKVGEDPYDELKGCSLLALWPAHIKAKELFSLLTSPKKDYVIGAYHSFLLKHLLDKLSPIDLPLALKWVEEQQSIPKTNFTFERVGDQIMMRAWNNLENPGVLQAFARAALSRLKNYKPIFEISFETEKRTRNLLIENNEKRHEVLEAMVPLFKNSEIFSELFFSKTPIILGSDIPWMIRKLKTTSSEKIQLVWAQLIKTAFDWRDPAYLDTIVVASQDNPILFETFSWLLKPVDLDSEEAQKMKRDHLERQKMLERIRSRPLLEPSPAERISLLLSECESGNLEAWWRLNMSMTLEADSTHYGDELESNLKVLPGWKNANQKTKRRIVEAAKKYILEKDPQTKSWLGTNILYRPAFAGLRAIRLLFQEDAAWLFSLPVNVWKKWAPIILAYPVATGSEAEENHKKLVKMAYQHVPDEIIEKLMILIDRENENKGHIFIINLVEDCWDERLADALLSKAKDEKLKPECLANLLSVLLEHKVEEAEIFAISLVPLTPPSYEVERSKAIVAAKMLMSYADCAGWPTVWSAIQKDSAFGREVMSELALSHWRAAKTEPRFTVNQLSDLYIWLVRQYPYAEDPEHEGVYTVGPREAVANLRDSILKRLRDSGTVQACKAIEHIAQEFPELDFLKWILIEAKNLTRTKTWVPPRPVDVLKIARNKQLRLVQNGEQLLEVIVESLEQLQRKLQGETPAAIDLWNEIARDKYRPKDEPRLSDYIKRYLDENIREKAIIANREVEIRRGEGSSVGEQTDIHVDAITQSRSRQEYDLITAIIEVKGCWNRDLMHAMKTQLVDRYLKDNRCQNGLYLVGWFNCKQWDDEDYRIWQVPKLTLNQAQELFDAQALELSKRDRHIRALVINTALR